MNLQTLFINAVTGAVRSSNVSVQPPQLEAILGTGLELDVAFFTDQLVGPVADVVSGSLVVKKAGDYTGEAVLLDLGWAVSGSGVGTRYAFRAVADSEELRAAIAGLERLTLQAQVEWAVTDVEEPLRSAPFDLTVINSYVQGDEGAPSLNPKVRVQRTTTETVLASAAPVQIWTWDLVANATYELELNLILSSGLEFNSIQYALAAPIVGAELYGRFTRYTKGALADEQSGVDEGGILFSDPDADGLDAQYMCPQKALVITAAAAGTMTLSLQSSIAGDQGWLRPGSWSKLTRLA